MMNNKVQIIVYANRFGENGISGVHTFLKNKCSDLFEGGVHLLPFYYPIDGADAGYDPIDHGQIDSRIGSWTDVKKFSMDFDLMADLIVNHISDQSKEFKEILTKGTQSNYFDLFLTMEKVFPNGSTAVEIEKIYRPRPTTPFSEIQIRNGEKHTFWTTFTRNQLDIDVNSATGKTYLESILKKLSENGIKLIRLDAAGYAVKKAGTSCFMLPETYNFINEFTLKAKNLGLDVLVEVHSHFRQQIEIAQSVDYVYDFALPPLILHSFSIKSFKQLKEWLKISPRNCITVLDTHDGIGIIDVAGNEGSPGLLTDEEVGKLVEFIHKNSNDESRIASGEGGANLDIYQVNCSFYDAIGRSDLNYLIARAIQFFCPGVPQVYYAGFLALENDLALMKKTGVWRDINRPFLTFEEIENALEKAVVKNLMKLIKFRNTHASFNGDFLLIETSSNQLKIRWEMDDEWSELCVDLFKNSMILNYGNRNNQAELFNIGEELAMNK